MANVRKIAVKHTDGGEYCLHFVFFFCVQVEYFLNSVHPVGLRNQLKPLVILPLHALLKYFPIQEYPEARVAIRIEVIEH